MIQQRNEYTLVRHVRFKNEVNRVIVAVLDSGTKVAFPKVRFHQRTLVLNPAFDSPWHVDGTSLPQHSNWSYVHVGPSCRRNSGTLAEGTLAQVRSQGEIVGGSEQRRLNFITGDVCSMQSYLIMKHKLVTCLLQSPNFSKNVLGRNYMFKRYQDIVNLYYHLN